MADGGLQVWSKTVTRELTSHWTAMAPGALFAIPISPVVANARFDDRYFPYLFEEFFATTDSRRCQGTRKGARGSFCSEIEWNLYRLYLAL